MVTYFFHFDFLGYHRMFSFDAHQIPGPKQVTRFMLVPLADIALCDQKGQFSCDLVKRISNYRRLPEFLIYLRTRVLVLLPIAEMQLPNMAS